MKKTVKKFIALCISFVLAVSAITVSVSAEEVYRGLSDVPPTYSCEGGINPQNNDYPEEIWNLSTDGMYTAEGKANGYAPIYTLYRFTGVKSISISISNKSSSDLEVKLYRCGIIDTTVGSFTVAANGNGGKNFLNLNSSGQYYFKFSAPCDFTAYIA